VNQRAIAETSAAGGGGRGGGGGGGGGKTTVTGEGDLVGGAIGSLSFGEWLDFLQGTNRSSRDRSERRMDKRLIRKDYGGCLEVILVALLGPFH
jgi:hypothetical protein